jgi:cytochrome c553
LIAHNHNRIVRMKPTPALMSIAASFTLGIRVAAAQQPAAPSPLPPPPSWAYGFAGAADPNATPPAQGRGGGRGATQQAAPDTTKRTLAGSSASFTLAQVRDGFGPADWFPNDHPPMPPIVAQGRRDAMITACALCHYPNGKGRPENAGVAGLPYEYFVKTISDFKNDARGSSDTRKTNTGRMIQFAKAMTDDEIKAAATYFSSMKWTPWLKVVETETVPKTRIAGGMFIVAEGAAAGTEPIGQRIIEVPDNAEQTETLRNPRSGFVAYVPTGAIKKGDAVAARGQCALCHGQGLQGLGPVPGIVGRSPSYIVRQMYDMQHGARTGIWSELMKRVVGSMTTEDMLDVAAYVASRAP